jgi:hypothetical protein
MSLSVEDLLAGGQLTHTIEVPAEVLGPGVGPPATNGPRAVRLRPLTVHDLLLITRAAKDGDNLVAALMVQRAMVEPAVSVAETMQMHAGLLQFLLHEVNRISGITGASEQLSPAMEAPLTKAAFILAKEFGWTPQQINDLTLGQVLLHLRMLKEQART